jgi:two-component system, cell cycle response regulator
MRVLTVDDSRAIRSIVGKNMVELGFGVEEAENGEVGLQKLFAGQFDLVILDVTMPVLDGPGMLEQMRAKSNKTPVLMLTSESSSSVVASVLKQGISDYILKPFQGDELKNKVRKILKITENSAAQPTTRTPVDILVVDDIENVAKKIRTMLPERLSMEHALTSKAALALCRERTFKVALLDTDLPETDNLTFLKQIRLLQPGCAVFLMPVRNAKNAEADAKTQGFDGVVYKPFDPEGIEVIVGRFAEAQEPVTYKDNLITLAKFTGKEDKIELYFTKLMPIYEKALKEAAAACFDCVVIDLSAAPARANRLPKLVMDFNERAGRVGLSLKIAGTQEIKQILNTFTDTGEIPFFESVEQALA